VFDGQARTLEFEEPFFWHVRVTRPATPAHMGGQIAKDCGKS